jgi:tRNA A-37 threonylcarbamoyl transferase component Bud32
MIGQLVLGTYELVDVLGQGGMSVVFKARHKMTDQEVALKILPPELAAHSQVKSRFLDEAKALAALDHPNIVHLYNFGQENGSFVLAMQFVQGRTWERAILENKRLDWKITCRITIDVLKALEYAHGRGVVHRDMKPSNVLVRATDGAATVMDFGIAKMTTSTKLTATGQTMGTVRYMSPEQVRGQEVDLRTDLYSLGATMYESLVGDTPFDGSTHFEIMTKHLSEPPKPPSKLGIDVPREIEDAMMRSLAKRAPDRFETARDFRKILEGVLMREGDVGLVETQRLARENLGEARLTKDERPPPQTPLGLAPTARAATANDLADELEPGTAASKARKRRWPVVVLALLVLGGGGAAAALMLTGGDDGYKSSTRIRGVKLTTGKKIGRVLVETDTKTTPDEVGAAYDDTLTKLAAFDAKVTAKLDVVDEIAAVPAVALCEPSAYAVQNTDPPADCKTALATTTYGKGGLQRLLVAYDRGPITAAMREGLASAVCTFQARYLDPDSDADSDKLKQICDMTERFKAAK